MIMLSPDEGGGGGSRGLDALGPVQTDLVPGDATVGDLEVQRQNELEQGEEGEKPGDKKVEEKKTDEEKPIVVDATELAKQFGAVIAAHTKQPEEIVPAKKKYDELSQEEREKIIDLWEPTKDWQAKYDNLETREEALKEMRNGMTKSAATISKLRVDELRDELNGTLTETRNYLRQMQNAAAEERLGKAYPDLVKPELQPIVKAVSDQLVEGGAKFKDEKALFDALAEGVTAVMHAGGAKDFKLSSGSNPGITKPKAKTNPNAITVTTPGAGGQAGGKTQLMEKPRGIAIFDK
jgi:hypothetical protein